MQQSKHAFASAAAPPPRFTDTRMAEVDFQVKGIDPILRRSGAAAAGCDDADRQADNGNGLIQRQKLCPACLDG